MLKIQYKIVGFTEKISLFFILQAQQLTDLEQKLAVAKNELEKAALDRVSSHPQPFTAWVLTKRC
jgi:hypothetical protein